MFKSSALVAVLFLSNADAVGIKITSRSLARNEFVKEMRNSQKKHGKISRRLSFDVLFINKSVRKAGLRTMEEIRSGAVAEDEAGRNLLILLPPSDDDANDQYKPYNTSPTPGPTSSPSQTPSSRLSLFTIKILLTILSIGVFALALAVIYLLYIRFQDLKNAQECQESNEGSLGISASNAPDMKWLERELES